ncbi:MAG TPA: trehalose-phosphatase [Anaeromyxobacteraceae bacterium]|nr:trehalose-phosphatase [Anaeromyxobacteraceae bacterium]
MAKDLLSGRHRGELERLASGRTLLAFDYDGVLAPLIQDPRGARMPASTRKLLGRLTRSWPVAVVSGRAYAHTLQLSGGIASVVVGNHGYELGHARAVPRRIVDLVRRWRAELEIDLEDQPGIYFEDKRSTLSVHYGLGGRWRAAEERVFAAAVKLDGARLVRGKKVLNVIPSELPNKGDALLALLRRMRLDVAFYAGDDVTDEDAFAIGPPRVFGVHVGHGRSMAPWRVATQDRVDELLRILAALRDGSR